MKKTAAKDTYKFNGKEVRKYIDETVKKIEVNIISQTMREVEKNILPQIELLNKRISAKEIEQSLLAKVQYDTILLKQEALYAKLDTHVVKERLSLEQIENNTRKIQDSDNELTQNIKDINVQLKELNQVTASARARTKFWSILHNVVETAPLLRPLKSKFGIIFYSFIFLLITNTILHTLGVDFNIISIIKWLLSLSQTN